VTRDDGEEMKKLFPTVLLLLLLAASYSLAQEQEPLELIQTVALPDLHEGDFDHFAADVHGNRLFLTAEANGKVLVFDLRTNKLVHTIDGLKLPHSMVYREEAKRLFVIDGGLGQIRIYDSNSYRHVDDIALRNGAGPMAFDAVKKYIYVVSGGRDGNQPESYLDVVDTSTGKKLAEKKMSSDDVEALVLEPSGRRLFVDVRGTNTIEVLDRTSLVLLNQWSVGQVAKKPSKMTFDEASHRLFVGARDPATLIILDCDSGAVITSLPGAAMVDDIFFDSRSKRIYFAGSDFVDVFAQRDPNHYERIGHVPTAFRAKTAILVPDLDRYYVAVPRHDAQPAQLRVYKVTH
jgi:DNA-binding beta-propeller fold protein YncE